MRRLKTYPALGSIALPRSAQILDVHEKGADKAASLVVSVDDADGETEERRFAVLRIGDPVPIGARFVASWEQHPVDGGIACLFELAEDIPADLPAEAVQHYRLLIRDGFEVTLCGSPGGGIKAWKAPVDVPPGQLSQEQIIAVVTLQEHGYGPVVNG